MDIYEEPDIDDGPSKPETEIQAERERQFPKAMELFKMLVDQLAANGLAANGVKPQLKYKEGDRLIALRGERHQFGAVIPKKLGICLLRFRVFGTDSEALVERLQAAGMAPNKLKDGKVVLTITEDILKTHAQLIANEVRWAAEIAGGGLPKS